MLADAGSIRPGEAAYVGDQESDVRFALEAGWAPVAYTGGVHSRARLTAGRARIFLDNFGDCPELLSAEFEID